LAQRSEECADSEEREEHALRPPQSDAEWMLRDPHLETCTRAFMFDPADRPHVVRTRKRTLHSDREVAAFEMTHEAPFESSEALPWLRSTGGDSSREAA
jgi:hypothetical protein